MKSSASQRRSASPGRWRGCNGSNAAKARLDDADRADWTLPSRIETALADIGLPGMALQRPARLAERW